MPQKVTNSLISDRKEYPYDQLPMFPVFCFFTPIDPQGNPQAGLDITADWLVLLDRVNGDPPTDSDSDEAADMSNVPF